MLITRGICIAFFIFKALDKAENSLLSQHPCDAGKYLLLCSFRRQGNEGRKMKRYAYDHRGNTNVRAGLRISALPTPCSVLGALTHALLTLNRLLRTSLSKWFQYSWQKNLIKLRQSVPLIIAETWKELKWCKGG